MHQIRIIAGPTATGKSAVAQYLAKRNSGVVLSADSMQVYRGMDIGTATPSLMERDGVAYLGVDLVDPWEPFDLNRYLVMVREQLAGVDPAVPVYAAGGSGLYLRALLEGLDGMRPDREVRDRWQQVFDESGVEGLQAALRERDPERLAALADPQNPRRLIRALEQVGMPVSRGWGGALPVMPVLAMEPATLNARIEARVEQMYSEGLLDEVRGLIALPAGLSETASQAIGYREAIDYLEGRCGEAEAKARTVVRTRRLAKRQRTWFRNQCRAHWIEVSDGMSVATLGDVFEEFWRSHGTATFGA